jgi:hypothetical protein
MTESIAAMFDVPVDQVRQSGLCSLSFESHKPLESAGCAGL